MEDDQEFQQRLAVLEVLAGAGLSGPEKADVIRRVMAAQATQIRASAALDAKDAELRQFLSDIAAIGAELRAFVWEVSRFRSEQVARLRRHLTDAAEFDAAVQRLDEVYRYHLELAVRHAGRVQYVLHAVEFR